MRKLLEFLPDLENFDLLVTVVFGLVSGVLTLIGLVSIFVSLNSQHNIQKCREIYWSLLKFKGRNEIIDDLLLYIDIYNDNEKFTSRVIRICTSTIYIVIFITLILNLLSLTEFKINEYIIVTLASILIWLILIKFAGILKDLQKLDKISSLPTVPQILDASAHTKGLNTVILAVNTLEVSIAISFDRDEEEGSLCISVGNPLPIKNVIVKLKSVSLKSSDSKLSNLFFANFDINQKMYVEENQIGLKTENIEVNSKIVFVGENEFDFDFIVTNNRYSIVELLDIERVPFDFTSTDILSIILQIEGSQGIFEVLLKCNIKEQVRNNPNSSDFLSFNHYITLENTLVSFSFNNEKEYLEFVEIEQRNTNVMRSSYMNTHKDNIIEFDADTHEVYPATKDEFLKNRQRY